MDKKRLTFRQGLTLGFIFLVTEMPRLFFFMGTVMTAFWLGCIAYVIAVGHPEAVIPVLVRAAVFAVIAVLGAVFHKLAGNEDQAWTHYMFWKKGGRR